MAMKFGKKNEIKLNPLAYNLALIGESGIGKEQPVSEPVLTEHGWMRMGDIQVGTKVYGEDGHLYNVTAVYPQGVKDVYEITFRDGTKTRCGLEHLWTVSTKKQRENMRTNNDERYKVLTTAEILKDYKKWVINPDHNNGGHFSYKYSVPINKCMEFDEREHLELSPYALGLLLGDGGFTESVATFTNSEDELFEQLENELVNLNIHLKFREFDNHKQAHLCTNDTRNLLNMTLKDLELWGCGSREKFIPEKYIYTSKQNRIDLLSGIINTDGSVNNSRICVATYSQKLANNIAELSRSLGFVATVNGYDRTNADSTKKYDLEIEYHVNIISSDFSMLRLSSKHTERLSNKHVEYVKSISEIKLVGKEESQCIMVDNPNHLYITNDYIVTHNTTVIKEYVEKLAGEDGYMFLEIGKEDGADAIDGIQYLTCPEWDQDYDEETNSIGFNTFVEDVVENRATDWKDLKVVVIDTYDELFAIAEPEVIAMHNKENPTKRVKSIKAAFGGFMAGEDKAIEIVLDRLWALKKVGVSFIVIGHTKTRNVTDPITGEDYMQLTTNMSQRYFNAMKTKVHFLGVAAIDREIVKKSTGKKNVVTGQEIKKGVIKGETRKITFRDDNFVIDSKSRFADIVESIPLDADALIKAVTDAIAVEQKKSGASASDLEQRQKQKEADRIAKLEAHEKEKKTLSDALERIMAFVAENKSDMQKLMPMLEKCRELGYANPKEITSAKDALSVLAVIE